MTTTSSELREHLLDLAERMDDFLPAPTVEAGWVLEAVDMLGKQQRECEEVLAAEIEKWRINEEQPLHIRAVAMAWFRAGWAAAHG